jgi:small subunit ribosomal protein S17
MSKQLVGIVSSDKADKTITVTVVTRKTHPIYKKQFSVSTKFIAHDSKNEAKVGDKVSIVETKPISARKRFKLEEVIERPVLRDDDLAAVKSEDNGSGKVDSKSHKTEEPEEPAK